MFILRIPYHQNRPRQTQVKQLSPIKFFSWPSAPESTQFSAAWVVTGKKFLQWAITLLLLWMVVYYTHCFMPYLFIHYTLSCIPSILEMETISQQESSYLYLLSQQSRLLTFQTESYPCWFHFPNMSIVLKYSNPVPILYSMILQYYKA